MNSIFFVIEDNLSIFFNKKIFKTTKMPAFLSQKHQFSVLDAFLRSRIKKNIPKLPLLNLIMF